MGGFSSGGNPLMQVGAAAIDAYTGVPVASTALSLAQASAQQGAQADAVQQNYDRQAELLRRQQQREVRDRQDLLRRATASQRARLGAMGVGGGGSSEALIGGLQRQAATELADLEADFGDRRSVLDWTRQRQEDQLSQARQRQWLSQLMPVVDEIRPKKTKKKEIEDGGEFNLL